MKEKKKCNWMQQMRQDKANSETTAMGEAKTSLCMNTTDPVLLTYFATRTK